jgi:hypothetical protein
MRINTAPLTRTEGSGMWTSATAVNKGKILSALSTGGAAVKGSLFEKCCV